jgi:hypothetical protein
MRRLLILSCAKRKRQDAGLLPAIDRYDGPAFRLLRRFREHGSELPDVFVLSARYGLIHYAEPISNYDQRMTLQRAHELRFQISETLQLIFKRPANRKKANCHILFCMGNAYFDALKSSVPAGVLCEHAEGSIGKKLSKLKQWLYGPSMQSQLKLPSPQRGRARLRGVDITINAAEALYRAQRALPRQQREAASYHSWYVLVGNERVSPKWLVSLLTGLPVSAFHSDEARRVLYHIGIEVHCMFL